MTSPKSPRRPSSAVRNWDKSTWRASRIPENQTICKTYAMREYHLNKKEVEELKHKSDVTTTNAKGSHMVVSMHLYKERQVEMKAWEKYGGPEGFEIMLDRKEAAFRAKPANAGKVFSRRPKYYPSTNPSYRAMSLNTQLLHTDTPTVGLVRIKEHMVLIGQKWVWDKINELISSVYDCPLSTMGLSGKEREALVEGARRDLRDYPARPASPPPESPAFSALRDILQRAPVYRRDEDNPGIEVATDGMTGSSWPECWTPLYTDGLYTCLIELIHAHGLDGWKQARWMVYDKYAECGLGGPSYSTLSAREKVDYRCNLSFSDGGKYWLGVEKHFRNSVLPGLREVYRSELLKINAGPEIDSFH